MSLEHARVLGRRAVALPLGLALAPVLGAPPALAHDPIEEALARGAGPPEWVSLVGVWGALLASFVAAALPLRRRWRPNAKAGPRYLAPVAQLLAVWLLLGYLQSATARMGGTPASLLVLGFFVFPLALFAVWAFVFANFRGMLGVVLRQRRYRWIAGVVAVAFAGFYLWSSNLVGVPEPEDLTQGGKREAFVIIFSAYGPLAIWPNVEFWLPQLQVFGAISIGVAMVVGTVSALMGLTWASLVFSLKVRRRQGALAGRTGAFAVIGTIGTNFCCCCAPAAYPLMALVLGTSTASSLGAWLVGSSSPFYNAAQVGMLVLMLAAMSSIRKRTGDMSPGA